MHLPAHTGPGANQQEPTMQTVKIARTFNLPVHEDRFNDEIRAYIWNYGLRQILNDAGASFKDPAEKLAAAGKRLDALYEGVIRKTREAKNPLDAIALRMAKEVFKGAFGWGKGLTVGKLMKWASERGIEFDAENEEELAEGIDKVLDLIAGSAQIQERAKAEIERKQAVVNLIDNI